MISQTRYVLAVLLSLTVSHAAEGFSAFGTKVPVSDLLVKHADSIKALKEEASSVSVSDAPDDDIFYLRYCLDPDNGEMKTKLVENMKWRAGEGKGICDAAKRAVSEATSAGGWDNSPVRAAAPHAAVINEHITISQCVTTTSRQGDLVYCIRAGKIDDVALMSKVSVEEMTEFFIYCKEINAIVANARSASSDKLACIITANDLAGVKLIGGDATFRKALSMASSKANSLYPSTAGPTLLLNLPKLLGALAKLFTPLFPEEVRQRLKFQRGPLKDIEDLSEIMQGSSRDQFLDSLDELVYKDL